MRGSTRNRYQTAVTWLPRSAPGYPVRLRARSFHARYYSLRRTCAGRVRAAIAARDRGHEVRHHDGGGTRITTARSGSCGSFTMPSSSANSVQIQRPAARPDGTAIASARRPASSPASRRRPVPAPARTRASSASPAPARAGGSRSRAGTPASPIDSTARIPPRRYGRRLDPSEVHDVGRLPLFDDEQLADSGRAPSGRPQRPPSTSSGDSSRSSRPCSKYSSSSPRMRWSRQRRERPFAEAARLGEHREDRPTHDLHRDRITARVAATRRRSVSPIAGVERTHDLVPSAISSRTARAGGPR